MNHELLLHRGLVTIVTAVVYCRRLKRQALLRGQKEHETDDWLCSRATLFVDKQYVTECKRQWGKDR